MTFDLGQASRRQRIKQICYVQTAKTHKYTHKNDFMHLTCVLKRTKNNPLPLLVKYIPIPRHWYQLHMHEYICVCAALKVVTVTHVLDRHAEIPCVVQITEHLWNKRPSNSIIFNGVHQYSVLMSTELEVLILYSFCRKSGIGASLI